MSIFLVLGGTRSGKSAFAEALLIDRLKTEPAHGAATVGYIAPAELREGDDDFSERIAKHRQIRPSHWHTYELAKPDDIFAILESDQPLIIDSFGSWLIRYENFAADIDRFITYITRRSAITVIVSEEVGLSVHPPSTLGRKFTDDIGTANIALSQHSQETYLVIAGNPIQIRGV